MTQTQKNTIIFAVPALILAAAFFGNLFVEGWNWSGFDFLAAGVLLFGTAFTVRFIINSKKTFRLKLILSIAVILILVLVWIELAVGLFGSPFAGS